MIAGRVELEALNLDATGLRARNTFIVVSWSFSQSFQILRGKLDKFKTSLPDY